MFGDAASSLARRAGEHVFTSGAFCEENARCMKNLIIYFKLIIDYRIGILQSIV